MRLFRSVKKALHNRKIVLLTLGFSSAIGLTGCGKEKSEYVPLYTSIQIQQGDTLSELAQDFYKNDEYENAEVYKNCEDLINDIMQINHMEDSNYLKAGGYLIVPYYVTPEKASELSVQKEIEEKNYIVEYCVKKEDTLNSLARRYDISVEILCKENGYFGYIPLPVGTILSIPTTVEKAIENGDLPKDYIINYNPDYALSEEDTPKRR